MASTSSASTYVAKVVVDQQPSRMMSGQLDCSPGRRVTPTGNAAAAAARGAARRGAEAATIKESSGGGSESSAASGGDTASCPGARTSEGGVASAGALIAAAAEWQTGRAVASTSNRTAGGPGPRPKRRGQTARGQLREQFQRPGKRDDRRIRALMSCKHWCHCEVCDHQPGASSEDEAWKTLRAA